MTITVSPGPTRRQLPHPPHRVPLVGDVLGFSLMTPSQSSARQARTLGPIFERKIFGTHITLVAGADLVEDLVDETRFEKYLPPALLNLRGIVGDGLFTAFNDEPSWQQAHDLLRPAFSQTAMRGYHDVMLDVVGQLTERWDAGTGTPVDVAADMTKVTLETIGRTGFSYSFGSFERETPHPFVRTMVRGLTHSLRRIARPPVVGNLLMRRADRRHEQDVRVMFDLVEDVIRARQLSGAAGPDDLLGLMLAGSADAAALDPVNVRNQIITFLVAGHETTSGALSFALYYLSRHPDVVERARAEIDAVWGTDEDRPPTYEQIAKLRYVRRTLDESLRLWPTVPAFARAARHDTVIGGGRHAMAAGDWAIVLVAALHRDPAWGADPDVFDPDRFSPERVRSRPGHLYKPFGTGERACIGRQFAVHEAVLVLGILLRRYDLTPDPDYTLSVSERLTLMPSGFMLTPRRRQGCHS